MRIPYGRGDRADRRAFGAVVVHRDALSVGSLDRAWIADVPAATIATQDDFVAPGLTFVPRQTRVRLRVSSQRQIVSKIGFVLGTSESVARAFSRGRPFLGSTGMSD